MKPAINLLLLLMTAIFLTPQSNSNKPFGVIDDSYDVNPGGAYNHIIPIHAPSGVKGLTPNLALVYDSRSGISEFGYGWALSGLSKVVRVGNNYAQHGKTMERTFTIKDAFLLDGQYLSCISGTNGKPQSTYRTENETFSVIRALDPLNTAEASPKFFVVKQQNGLTYYYGNSTDSRVEVNLSIAHKEVLEWNVNMIRDPFGNYIKFEYEQINNTARIKTIQYTGNDRIGLDPKNEITFNYEEDNIKKRKENQLYVAGIPIVNNNVMRNIAVGTNGRFFKFYHFTYDNDNNHLKEVKESTDEEGLNSIPVTHLDWNLSDTLGLGGPVVLKLPVSQDGSNTTFQDMDGDGQKEFIWFKNENRNGKDSIIVSIYKRSAKGYETLAFYKALDSGNATNLLRNVKLFDADGDGDKDILTGHRILQNNSSPSKIEFDESSSFDCKDCFLTISNLDENGRLLTLDLNGDSKEEVIAQASNGKCSVYGFDQAGKFTLIGEINTIFYKIFTDDFSGIGKGELLFLNVAPGNVIVANVLKIDNNVLTLKPYKIPAEIPVTDIAAIRFQDINGDGISDLLLQKPNEKARIWINTGNNFTTESTRTPNIFGSNGNPKSAFGYFTSSEYLQFLTVTNDVKFELWNITLNTTNQLVFTAVDPQKIKFPKDIMPYTQFDRLVFSDFDNDGKIDLSFTPQDIPEMIVYSGTDLYTNLLTNVTDGFGNTVKVEYSQLTDTSLYKVSHDESAPTFTRYWGPYTIVKTLQYSNGLGTDSMNSVRYHYEDLMLELRGRGLAGFRAFSKTESNNSIEIRTEFDYHFPFTGKILREVRATADKLVYFDQQNEWQVRQYKAGSALSDAIAVRALDQVKNFNETKLSYLPVLISSTVIKKDLDKKQVSNATIQNSYNTNGQIIETRTLLDDKTVAVTQREFKNIDIDISEKATYILGLTASEISFAYKGSDTTEKRTINYEYDETTGALKSKIRQKGNALYEQVATFEYDNTGNLILKRLFPGTVDEVKETFDYTVDRRFVQSHIDELGFKVQYVYDPRYSSVIQTTDINGLVSKCNYDDFGNLTKEVQPDGREKTYDYGFLRTQEDLFHGRNSNAVYKMTIHESGNQESVMYYDKLGREVSSRYYLLDSTIYDKPIANPGHVTIDELTASSGKRMVIKHREFDNRGNVAIEYKPQYIQLINGPVLLMANGKLTKKRMDCVQFEDSLRYKTKYQYDIFNRLITITLPDGNVQKTEYEAKKVTEYDLKQHRKIAFYDGKGQIEKVTNDQGNAIKYTYDLRGNLLQVLSPDGSAIETTYDLIGRKSMLNDPNIGIVKYTYDRFDRLKTEVVNDSKQVKMEYDKAGRLTIKTTPEGTTSYSYDHERNGKLDQIIDAAGNKNSYTYDNLGRTSSEIREINHKKYSVNLTYDLRSRLSTKTYPNGFKVSFFYENNILTNIKDQTGKSIWRLEAVDADGKVLRKILGNGLETKYSYNRYNGLIEQLITDKATSIFPTKLLACSGNTSANFILIREYEKPSIFPPKPLMFDPKITFPKWASQQYNIKSDIVENTFWKKQFVSSKIGNPTNPVQNLTFTYDESYNLGSKVDEANKIAEEYNYDNLNRLTKVTQLTNDGRTEETFNYDGGGNITSKSNEGVYQYDALAKQRVKYVTNNGKAKYHLYYDAYGNIAGDSVSTLQINYTSFNKPDTITKGSLKKIIKYGYDNEQIGTILYNEDGQNEVTTIRPFADYEITQDGKKETAVSSLYIGGEPVMNEYQIKEGGDEIRYVNYIHIDHLGSVSAITNEYGQKIAGFTYTAFGVRKAQKESASIFIKGFTGHDQLDEFELIDCNGRYYMPSIGRFLSADPFVSSITDLQGLNRYSYVGNNPINTVDPSGYWGWNPVKALGSAVGAIVGGVSSAISNVGRAVVNAAEAYVGLYAKAYEEGNRFVNKYGKQLIIIAAAVAITYVSGGSMAGLGLAMLQGAAIGAGVGAGITAIRGGSFSDILNAGFNGAITGASVAAMSYGLASGANAVFDGSAAGKHILGGVNGYMSSGGGNQDKGFLRGVAASFIPADLGATSAFEASKTANFMLTIGSAAARGYVINGEEGMRMQVYGGVATMAIGHIAALYASGGEGYQKFEKGIYIYKSNEGSFSIGGSIALEKGAWNPNTGDINNTELLDHEMKHFTEQNTLGAMYLPVHASRSIGLKQLEKSPFNSNPEGGNYHND